MESDLPDFSDLEPEVARAYFDCGEFVIRTCLEKEREQHSCSEFTECILMAAQLKADRCCDYELCSRLRAFASWVADQACVLTHAEQLRTIDSEADLRRYLEQRSPGEVSDQHVEALQELCQLCLDQYLPRHALDLLSQLPCPGACDPDQTETDSIRTATLCARLCAQLSANQHSESTQEHLSIDTTQGLSREHCEQPSTEKQMSVSDNGESIQKHLRQLPTNGKRKAIQPQCSQLSANGNPESPRELLSANGNKGSAREPHSHLTANESADGNPETEREFCEQLIDDGNQESIEETGEKLWDGDSQQSPDDTSCDHFAGAHEFSIKEERLLRNHSTVADDCCADGDGEPQRRSARRRVSILKESGWKNPNGSESLPKRVRFRLDADHPSPQLEAEFGGRSNRRRLLDFARRRQQLTDCYFGEDASSDRPRRLAWLLWLLLSALTVLLVLAVATCSPSTARQVLSRLVQPFVDLDEICLPLVDQLHRYVPGFFV